MCSRTLAALVGTMMLGGDLWFETFAVPWIADEVPGAFHTDPTVVLALGAVSSYLLMAIGWVLYGIASWRGRVFPRTLSASLVIGGVLAFNALLAPFGIALGLAVGAVGVWLVRTGSRATQEVAAAPQAVTDRSHDSASHPAVAGWDGFHSRMRRSAASGPDMPRNPVRTWAARLDASCWHHDEEDTKHRSRAAALSLSQLP